MTIAECGRDIELTTVAHHQLRGCGRQCQRLGGEHVLAEAGKISGIVGGLVIVVLSREPVEVGIAVTTILSGHAEQTVAGTDKDAEIE